MEQSTPSVAVNSDSTLDLLVIAITELQKCVTKLDERMSKIEKENV